MARSWSGFIPQNQYILLQWGAMEAATNEILSILMGFPRSKKSKNEADDSKLPDALVLGAFPRDPE